VTDPQPFTLNAGPEAKRHAPATARNRDAIADMLSGILPATGTVLEIASGTGEHIVHFAGAFPQLLWQPSDHDVLGLESISAWSAEAGLPNLLPPVRTMAEGAAYRARALAALPAGSTFTPLITCYLTDDTDPDDVERGFKEGVFTAVKLYPANATTNSAAGVSDLSKLSGVFETLERIGMPLLIHGEVTDGEIDIFDREAVFIERHLEPLLGHHPGLKVVLEHITTAEAADFVQAAGPNLAATITPHHLHINRNAMFRGGLRPHFYCLPVAKREVHRLALRRAATSGSDRFFLGTDSAPHAVGAKESACGCAGIFNAPFAIESYARTFEEEGALHHLEAFASENGPRFYGLPLNEDRIRLDRVAHQVPEMMIAADTEVVPFHAGQTLGWKFACLAGH
jgi:dihydroorotase